MTDTTRCRHGIDASACLACSRERRNSRRTPETICEAYQEFAYQAVDDWDGTDNGDLFVLMAERLGISRSMFDAIADYVRDGLEGACSPINRPDAGLLAICEELLPILDDFMDSLVPVFVLPDESIVDRLREAVEKAKEVAS